MGKKRFKLDPIVSKRINAFTIDLFLIFVIQKITVNSFVNSLDLVFFRFPFKIQYYFLSHQFSIFANITLISIFFAYFALFPFISNGRTPGKYIVGLRIFSKSHELTLLQCMTRSFLNLFSVFTFCLPFLAVMYKKNHIGISDYLAKTHVDLEKRPYIVDHESSWQLSFFDLTNGQDHVETSNVLTLKKESTNVVEAKSETHDQDKAA